jgi:hypothetical protein
VTASPYAWSRSGSVTAALTGATPAAARTPGRARTEPAANDRDTGSRWGFSHRSYAIFVRHPVHAEIAAALYITTGTAKTDP